MFLVDSETASMGDHQVDGRCFQKLRVFEKRSPIRNAKMQMYTTGKLTNGNGKSRFLMGATSSNVVFP